MGYQSLLVDRADGIATLTMNRPEARNALDIRMREELVDALDEIERDSTVRVVILTGAGSAFSSGGNVKKMHEGGGLAGGLPARAGSVWSSSIDSSFACSIFPSRPSRWWTASRWAPAATSRSAAT